MRIGIIGIGGVGGYFGGLLADKYSTLSNIEIIFITKPNAKAILKAKGLKLITSEYDKNIFADVYATDDLNIPPLNVLLCAVKSYNLEESLTVLKSGLTSNTILMPLQNGIDAKARIEMILPNNPVIEACVYIVAQLTEPGIVKVNGAMRKLYFGNNMIPMATLQILEKIMLAAGIDCYIATDITLRLWRKFIFVSSIASITTYLNLPIGKILEVEEYKNMLKDLIIEIKNVAQALSIVIPDNIVESTISELHTLPYDATSSMQRDFNLNKDTECKSLTHFVSDTGKALNIATPVYDKISIHLKEKTVARII